MSYASPIPGGWQRRARLPRSDRRSRCESRPVPLALTREGTALNVPVRQTDGHFYFLSIRSPSRQGSYPRWPPPSSPLLLLLLLLPLLVFRSSRRVCAVRDGVETSGKHLERARADKSIHGGSERFPLPGKRFCVDFCDCVRSLLWLRVLHTAGATAPQPPLMPYHPPPSIHTQRRIYIYIST